MMCFYHHIVQVKEAQIHIIYRLFLGIADSSVASTSRLFKSGDINIPMSLMKKYVKYLLDVSIDK